MLIPFASIEQIVQVVEPPLERDIGIAGTCLSFLFFEHPYITGLGLLAVGSGYVYSDG